MFDNIYSWLFSLYARSGCFPATCFASKLINSVVCGIKYKRNTQETELNYKKLASKVWLELTWRGSNVALEERTVAFAFTCQTYLDSIVAFWFPTHDMLLASLFSIRMLTWVEAGRLPSSRSATLASHRANVRKEKPQEPTGRLDRKTLAGKNEKQNTATQQK